MSAQDENVILVHLQEVSKADNIGGRPLSLGEDIPIATSVEGTWRDGILKLEFVEPEGTALILIEGVFSEEKIQINVDMSHHIGVNIGYSEEPILITVKTSMGNIYCGMLGFI